MLKVLHLNDIITLSDGNLRIETLNQDAMGIIVLGIVFMVLGLILSIIGMKSIQ